MMNRALRNLPDVYSAAAITGLVILTALGNAIAMLVFSAAMAVLWFIVPGIRGQTAIRRGLLAGAIAFVVALSCAWMLSRGL